MKEQTQSAIRLLEALTERAKELTCLYAIEEALHEPDTDVDRVCESIIEAIPPGWQYPDVCAARIILESKEYRSKHFEETQWKLSVPIVQHDRVVGSIGVYYTREKPEADIGPFLKEEKKLIETIADRLDHFLTYRKMKHVFQESRIIGRDSPEAGRGDWETVLDLIRQTDNALFLRISNKMLNHLCWSGIDEAEALRQEDKHQDVINGTFPGDEAKGHRLNRLLDFSTEFTERIFRIAADHLSSDEILSRVQMWIQEDKLGALLRTVRRRLPLAEVSASLRRYFLTTREETYERYPLARGLKALLIECILSDRIDYIVKARDYIGIEDLYNLLQNVIVSPGSHGRLGGKSADLFLASQILKNSNGGARPVSAVRIPKSWYIPADMMLEFIHYNNMDEVIEQKYKDIERVRLEYPHVIDMFQQTVFPPELATGLSLVLDALGGSPIVVRSSSLLEERTGSCFAGKYKSVFLGNQGSREGRLHALMCAVAEVYASNFGPDAIEYRAEHGWLEFSEQMSIMIQEVVGTRAGRYFFPAYSGVARSLHDVQWTHGIRSNGGIAHMVPGLGTRTSSRTGEEHPVLVVLSQPSMQANESADECIHRAPKMIDVIDLETNRVRTLDLGEFMRETGRAYPGADQIMSVCENGRMQPLKAGMKTSRLEPGSIAATFEGLVMQSPFVVQVRGLLRTLEEKLEYPVEIEFASDGEHLYLLQCRPQSLARKPRPAPIPKDIAADRLIFSANRYVLNGRASNITHIVCVNPEAYAGLDEPTLRGDVVQVVARLNMLLPKRQFILMCKGRWSDAGRGTCGMGISFGDFKHAAVLVELMQPDSSRGMILPADVRFLQEITESGILYLPLFPGEEGTCFNERFFTHSSDILSELLPEYAHLAGVVRVIDVQGAADGKVMQVLMNAELGEAVGFLSDPEQEIAHPDEEEAFENGHPENYWRWRYRMAERIAELADPAQFGIEGMYVFGSTKNGTAGPASDIDMLIHFRGTESQREMLVKWLEGWSLCLDEINYLRTGYRAGGLLDFHIITDEDIAQKSSYAVKIHAITDAARPLRMKQAGDEVRKGPDTHA